MSGTLTARIVLVALLMVVLPPRLLVAEAGAGKKTAEKPAEKVAEKPAEKTAVKSTESSTSSIPATPTTIMTPAIQKSEKQSNPLKPLVLAPTGNKVKSGPWRPQSPVLAEALAKIQPSWKQGIYGPIKSMLKPGVMKRIIENREVFTNADLEYVGHPDFEYLGGYEFYAVALVRASIRQTEQILKKYNQYKNIIPLVKISRWYEKRKELLLGGTIWKYRLRSWVKIKEKPLKGAEFKIVRGALKGLYGDIFYESAGEKGTIVYLRGFLKGIKWPPKLILEQGAEVALTLAANKMRAYVEDHKGEFKVSTDVAKKGRQKGMDKKNREREKNFPKPRKSL